MRVCWPFWREVGCWLQRSMLPCKSAPSAVSKCSLQFILEASISSYRMRNPSGRCTCSEFFRGRSPSARLSREGRSPPTADRRAPSRGEPPARSLLPASLAGVGLLLRAPPHVQNLPARSHARPPQLRTLLHLSHLLIPDNSLSAPDCALLQGLGRLGHHSSHFCLHSNGRPQKWRWESSPVRRPRPLTSSAGHSERWGAVAQRRRQGRPRPSPPSCPGNPVREPREKWALVAASRPTSWRARELFPGRPRAALGVPPPRGAAPRALRGLSEQPPRAPPTRGPLPLPASPPPAGSRLLPDSREFQPRLPAPAPPTLARALRAPPPSSRAAAPANEVRGRVRRFKRRLWREAGREIRRRGQNPAGRCEPCRVARCGDRAGVGARGKEAERRREGPAEGGSAPADMLGASLTGPGRG